MKMYLFDKAQKVRRWLTDKDFIEARLTEQINAACELKFSMPVKNALDGSLFYAAVPHPSGNGYVLCKIISESKQDDRVEYEAIEAAYDELQAYNYLKDVRPHDRNAGEMLSIALQGTRWTSGVVYGGATGSTNFYYISTLEAIKKIVELFGLEVTFTVTIDPQTNQITRRQVNLYAQQGQRTGKRFEYGSNLLSVTREEARDGLITALIGRGKGEQVSEGQDGSPDGYGRRIDFADIVWSKANGNPADKPYGQEYVEDKDATAAFGFDNGKPRIGLQIFEDITDKAELLKATWAALQTLKRPQVSFKASVGDVGSLGLGDTVAIIRHDIGIEYFTRVYKVDHNLLDEKQNEIELGDDFDSDSITRTVSNVAGSVSQVKQVASYAATAANGKNTVNYGSPQPQVAAEGDIWYKDLGNGETDMMQYRNGNWVLVTSTRDLRNIEKKVNDTKAALDKEISSAFAAVEDEAKKRKEIDDQVNQALASAKDDFNTKWQAANQAVIDEKSARSAADSAATAKINAANSNFDKAWNLATQANAKADSNAAHFSNIDAGGIKTGTLNAGLIKTGSMSADRIVGGSLDFSSITAKNLSASRLTAGTIDGNVITVKNLKGEAITSGIINANLIKTGLMSADRISGGSLDFNNITAKNLSASKIVSGTLDTTKVTISGSLSANLIKSGTMSADRISGGSISASLIAGGTLDFNKAEISNLSADDITSGTLNAGNVNVINLNADNITSGTLSGSQMQLNLDTGRFWSYQFDSNNNYSHQTTIDKNGINDWDASGNTINISNGELAVYNSDGEGFFSNKGSIEFSSKAYFDKDSLFKYGKIELTTNVFQTGGYKGLNIIGAKGWLIKTADFNGADGLIARSQEPYTGSAIGGADGVIALYAQKGITMPFGEKRIMKNSEYTNYKGIQSYLELDQDGRAKIASYNFSVNTHSDDNSCDSQIVMNEDSGILMTSENNNGDHKYVAIGMNPNFGNGQVNINGMTTIWGDFSVTGEKNAAVKTSQGTTLINAYETAEYYFGDIGESSTDESRICKVMIDPLFLETVNTSIPYQVFVSPYSGDKVWVAERYDTFFVVKSDKPNAKFTWELKAKRLGYENNRLEVVNIKKPEAPNEQPK